MWHLACRNNTGNVSLQPTGILSILDMEFRHVHSSPESLINRIKVQHRNNDRYIRCRNVKYYGGTPCVIILILNMTSTEIPGKS